MDSNLKTVIVDVDSQHDFVHPDGALHVRASESVPQAIRQTLERAEEQRIPILGSVDSHAHDAWEFMDNGGPFPPHCIKGQPGWLRVFPELPQRMRFLPMQTISEDGVQNLVGERREGEGNRILLARDLAREAIEAGVGLYFEKEVYSLLANPTAEPLIATLVECLGGRERVRFDLVGYCTGGYCVDAAARGLSERGYRVRVLAYATAAIGGERALQKSKSELGALGIEWVEKPEP